MTDVEHRLEDLSKAVASGHTRRGVVKLGLGFLGAAVVAALPGRASAHHNPSHTGGQGSSDCAHFCNDFPEGQKDNCLHACKADPCARNPENICPLGGDPIRCCPEGPATCCGTTTCCRAGETCCPTLDGSGRCCPQGTGCCGTSSCCRAGETCCPTLDGRGRCCPQGTGCCGTNNCCRLGDLCCPVPDGSGRGFCCPQGTTCCGTTCCGPGQICCQGQNRCLTAAACPPFTVPDPVTCTCRGQCFGQPCSFGCFSPCRCVNVGTSKNPRFACVS
jgi:hypothetical protein